MNQAEQDLLVLTAQNGNQKAFCKLFDLYHRSLVGFAFNLSKDLELSKDAAQEAWIKAARNIRELNDPRAFKSWIYRLVRWKTIDLLRASVKHKAMLETETVLEDIDESSCDLFGDHGNAAEHGLAEAIQSLPTVEKQIIHLFYMDELSIAEVSTVLEIPAGTVKSRLNRARNRLRETCQKSEIKNEY